MKKFKASFIFDILLILICLHFAISAIFDLWLKNYLLNKVNSQPGGKQKLEIGSLHAIETGAAKAILADLKSRPKGWLFNAGKKAATFVADDFAEWCSR